MTKFDYKKSLGQNFLIDNKIIHKIVGSIDATEKDLIIEIGPGSGAITKHLPKYHANVICFEVDERLKSTLSQYESNKLELIFSDFLKIDINSYINEHKYEKLIFIGNLPYYITTAIINKIVSSCDASEIIIMVQKEVANRFNAKPFTKDYSSISVFLQYNFQIKKVCDVSKNCFEPIPKVDSTVLKLVKKEKFPVKNIEHFYKLVHDSFMQKRKNLRNNLRSYDLAKIEHILKETNKDLTYRAEQLTVEDFINISNELN